MGNETSTLTAGTTAHSLYQSIQKDEDATRSSDGSVSVSVQSKVTTQIDPSQYGYGAAPKSEDQKSMWDQYGAIGGWGAVPNATKRPTMWDRYGGVMGGWGSVGGYSQPKKEPKVIETTSVVDYTVKVSETTVEVLGPDGKSMKTWQVDEVTCSDQTPTQADRVLSQALETYDVCGGQESYMIVED